MIEEIRHIFSRACFGLSASASGFLEAVSRIRPDSRETTSPDRTADAIARLTRSAAARQLYMAHTDWIWPRWIENQYGSRAAFPIAVESASLLENHLERRWTPVLHATREMPAGFVDAAGLVTPAHRLFSLDIWIRLADTSFFSSQMPEDAIRQHTEEFPGSRTPEPFNTVITRWKAGALKITQQAAPASIEDNPGILLELLLENSGPAPIECEAAFSIRPYTMDDMVLIHDLVYNTRGFWMSENQLLCQFLSGRPDASWASTASRGDVARQLTQPGDDFAARCRTGLATAASLFRHSLSPGQSARMLLFLPAIPLNPRFFRAATIGEPVRRLVPDSPDTSDWLSFECTNQPDWNCTFHSSLLALKAHSAYPETWTNPFRPRGSRHWTRNIGLYCRGLLDAGFTSECARFLNLATLNQWNNGCIAPEPGCWDSTGQFIHAVARLALHPEQRDSVAQLYPHVIRAARWIARKRHDISLDRSKPRGIMPAGWRADDLDGLEYQFWDNFWSLAALRDARLLAEKMNVERDALFLQKHFELYRADLLTAINRALEFSPDGTLPDFMRTPAGIRGPSLNRIAQWPLELEFPGIGKTPPFPEASAIITPWMELIQAGAEITRHPFAVLKQLDALASISRDTGFFPQSVTRNNAKGCGPHGYDLVAAALWVSVMHNLLISRPAEESQSLDLCPVGLFHLVETLGEIHVRNLPIPNGHLSFSATRDKDTIRFRITPQWTTPPDSMYLTLKPESPDHPAMKTPLPLQGGELSIPLNTKI